MFADAYKIARDFTAPLVTSVLRHDGSLSATLAAFVVVNPDGWIVTANHVVNGLASLIAAKKARDERLAALSELGDIPNKLRKKRERKLVIDPEWPEDWSAWWGRDGAVQLMDVYQFPAADLAVGRLDGFTTQAGQQYPVFKEPSSGIDPGTSLCRLGYPLHAMTPEYDAAAGRFTLPENQTPPPLFPIEGIYTRSLVADPGGDDRLPIMFLETSSPGLMGQSGGPIFDTAGTVWAIQSGTIHHELGFQPKPRAGKKGEVAHQFLNVGIGAHPATLTGFLSQCGVDFQTSDY